jgi:hypothetical protein
MDDYPASEEIPDPARVDFQHHGKYWVVLVMSSNGTIVVVGNVAHLPISSYCYFVLP